MQRTGRPIAPLAQLGYYRGFSTMDQRKFSDAKTREVVLGRVTNIPSIRFFTPEEARLLEIVCAHVIPQDDRDEAHRIPIVPTIDERLYEDRHDGYRYADMPPDQEAFRLGLQAIEQIAQHLHERSFVDLDALDGDRLLAMLHDGNPPAGGEIWQRMAVHRFWMLLIQYCIDTYYAHPWAWDEIGFDGPAYPRAYMRLEHGEPESWEVNERRYEWTAPASSVSDIYEPTPSAIEYPSPHPP